MKMTRMMRTTTSGVRVWQDSLQLDFVRIDLMNGPGMNQSTWPCRCCFPPAAPVHPPAHASDPMYPPPPDPLVELWVGNLCNEATRLSLRRAFEL